MNAFPYLKELSLKVSDIQNMNVYPFNIPAVKNLGKIRFESEVTFIVGENGTGKSTLIEAIAVALGFNPEGGTKNFSFGTHDSHSSLYQYLHLTRSYKKPGDGYFLRAESYFNVATNIVALDSQPTYDLTLPPVTNSYGGVPLHEQSHGESFLSLMLHRFGGKGMYLLDEPEAALSPMRQLAVLCRMKQLVEDESQFIIATHSPILLAYPNATILQVDDAGITEVKYEETDHYSVTKSFLDNPQRMLTELFSD